MRSVEMATLSAKLERLRERERARGRLAGPPDPMYALRTPIAGEAVQALEDRHAVRLPNDYRAFLTTLGDGGCGPSHYGLYGLEEAFAESRKTIYRLDEPFVPPGSVDEIVELEAPGMLLIGYEGCAFYHGLALSGDEAGSVWAYVEVRPGWIPLADAGAPQLAAAGAQEDYEAWYDALLLPANRRHRLSFSAWYEQWLDRLLESEP